MSQTLVAAHSTTGNRILTRHSITQEDDPLEAFMASVQQEVAANKPTNRHRPGLELDVQDNVADYMEVSLVT